MDHIIFAPMLSKRAKYAIHALVYLARHETKEPVHVAQIAESERIPRKFLEAILLDLRNAGILNSRKGRGGGYYLLRRPEEVNMAEVIRIYDGAIALIPCVAHRYYERCDECVDEATCGIHDVFREVREKTVEILKKSTLSEIISREQRLRSYTGTPQINLSI